jgi:hypothetical protein
MEQKEIEALIEECKEGSSEACFNLDKGHIQIVNKDRYIELLEDLIRTQFTKRNE